MNTAHLLKLIVECQERRLSEGEINEINDNTF